MRNLLLFATLALSSSAFAQVCNVDMVSTRNNRVLDSFRSYNDSCYEAKKECRKQIRLRGLLNRADCVERSVYNPTPNRPTPNRPTPNPYPNPNPYPTPDSSYDARRPLSPGEKVVYNRQIMTVIGTNFNGLTAVRDSYGFNTNNIPRERLSVTSGCNLGICAGATVINLNSRQSVTVRGLGYNDTFAVSDSYGFITEGLGRNNIAETSGCISNYYAQICTGNQVLTRHNQYMTVAGIQLDGKVVLKDSYGFLTVNVDSSDLVIVR